MYRKASMSIQVTRQIALPTTLNSEAEGSKLTVKSSSEVQVTEIEPSESNSDTEATKRSSQPHSSNSKAPEYLIASPYPYPAHQLDLTTVSIPNQLLAKALTILAPISPSYATTSYSECLNWSEVFTHLSQLCTEHNHKWICTEFYVVEFRSRLKAADQIDGDLLFQLDRESHREATESGGLLKYWFGEPDGERRNLATCEFYSLVFFQSVLSCQYVMLDFN